MKSTKKKKNTYVVNLDTTLCPLELFCLCKNTPMAVVTLNGEKLQENTNWNGSMLFPNPPATTMVNMYKQLKPIMGKKLASTIIEYHDKETKEPITFLFPTNEISTSYKSLEELKPVCPVFLSSPSVIIGYRRGIGRPNRQLFDHR